MGRTDAPSIARVMEVLGRQRVLARLAASLEAAA